jgi:protein-S-isoprenylcysteine O-methyltransferase Ste14
MSDGIRQPAPAHGVPAEEPGVIAPPPLVYLAALVGGWGLGWLWPASLVPRSARPVGYGLIAVSVALFALSLHRFRKWNTSVVPGKPATALVTDGPYRFSRNPIYLAFTLFSVGIGVAADLPWLFGLLVPALLVIRWGVVAREERYMERRFGEAYRRYKATVRRWV